ncbi:AAC(3) family N-acetyltransferase [Gorillibacterium massiliense]|uniref:AAC(3) family N-acetyltransferase n=1 Tax=Gorillibacterium massiliense TaxID=1280390 RepID=UPI0004AF80A4|nr:AAC(3) family N-acetyltransferase [Gorillibacterium massiliense]
MKSALTQSDVENGLRQLGIRPGMTLEVHSSLQSFGHLEGGAEALIDALMQSVGNEGAIVMPSFRLSKDLQLTEEDRKLGLTVKIRILDEDEEESGMGVVSDTFRKRSDVRTGEGIFRVSAWGKDADKHSSSGFQHLIDHDGWALLLGVDIYRLSSMHYVEDILPDAIRGKFQPSPEARIRYPENRWFIEAWQPDVKPWYTIQETAYEKGFITDGRIGDAKCMLLKVRPVIGLYRQALQINPFELYGLK